MKKVNLLVCLWAVLLASMSVMLSGCGTENLFVPITTVEETYIYTEKSQVYTRPAMTTEERRLDSLTLALDDGFYFCLTTDVEKADEFVNTQRTLLRFLSDSGVEIRQLRYYAVDYDDSYSDGENDKCYVALSHVKSYRQVLATLQTLWGDYTDYGYIYHVANAITNHLGWQTAPIEEVEQATLDAFFSENPDALNLVYPCFTTTYATEETVRNCLALSGQLVRKIDLSQALTKSINEQVSDFRALVDFYAQEISVAFSRQEHGYAYCGEYLPLKIMTTYAKHVIDHGYEDFYRAMYEEGGDHSLNYFSDYQSIFETMDVINEEITDAVEYFGLEDEAGIVTIRWFSGESMIRLAGKAQYNFYRAQNVYITQIDAYLHEYFHHLEHLMSPNLGESAQSQMFCELGRSRSQHSQYGIEMPFTKVEEWVDLFYKCTGHTYRSGVDDYFEVYDILCYITGEYDFHYLAGRNAFNSFAHYLLDLYGEDTTYQLMLFPDTMESITGKTWGEQEADWLQHMADKFAGIEIPDWVAGAKE